MKQFLNKLLARVKGKRGGEAKTSVPRITNETLAEDREAVLSKGKRYKYPLQQTKKRTIIISSVIAVLLVTGTALLTWWQLYHTQSTSQFMYRVTQILPLPVGKVAGEPVLYRDYLMELRSSIHYLTTKGAVNLSSDSGQRQLKYQKRQAMDKVLEQTLARKLARERGISVSSQEVDTFINQQIRSSDIGATKEDFEVVIREYYDWTFGEYRQAIREQLLRQKVVVAIDDEARRTAEEIKQKLSEGAKFDQLAKEYSDDASTRQRGGDVGFVSVNNPGPDGLVEVAASLKKNQVSEVVEGTGGLYIVKTLEKKDGQVRYARIFIGYNQFEERFATLKEQGKVREYIDIPDALSAAGTGQQPRP